MGQAIKTRYPAYYLNQAVPTTTNWDSNAEWDLSEGAEEFFDTLFDTDWFYKNFTVQIAGEAKNYITNSLTYEDVVGERSTMSFAIFESDQSREYEKGELVELTLFEEVMFRGFIDRAKAQKHSKNTDKTWGKIWRIEVIDNHYLADKRLVAFSAENEKTGVLVNKIIDDYLADEGVTVGQVDAGVEIREAVFNYVPATQALDVLAEKSGYIWLIDMDKQLYFVSPDANTAPWDLTPDQLLVDGKVVRLKGSVSMNKEAPRYRNQHIVKGGRATTDEQTETFVGDGERVSFTVGYHIAAAPTITLNGQAQTVGIKGVEDDKQWYWQKGDNTLTQERTDDPLVPGDELKITYIGEFPIVTRSQDPTKIFERQQLEGGTGIVEEVSQDGGIESISAGLELGNSKIARFGQESKILFYRTERQGLKAGMTQTVTLPEYNLNEVEMLIERIEFEEEDGIPLWRVQAVYGPTKGSWTRFFLEQRREAQAVVREGIGEGQTLILPYDFEKTWVEGNDPTDPDHPNIFSELYPSDSIYPSDDLYPVFDPADRVKYIAILDNAKNEVYRKTPSSFETYTDTEIETLTFIGPNDMVGIEAGYVTLVGGVKATEEIGTGILHHPDEDWELTKEAKTDLEALQISTKDFKWS